MIADEAYSNLVEKLIDSDEEIGTLYLEEKEITKETIKSALRRATISNKIIPVCGGSAFKNKGVQATLDAVIDYLLVPDIPSAEAMRSRFLSEGRDQNG